MDSIANLLGAYGAPQEPPEVRRIKAYVKNEFDREVHVALQGRNVIILAPTAALANALRLRLQELRRVCGLDLPEDSARKLSVRIGKPA